MANPFEAGWAARCPHCGQGVQFIEGNAGFPSGSIWDENVSYQITSVRCPLCRRSVIALNIFERQRTHVSGERLTYRSTRLIFPAVAGRKPIPQDVAQAIRSDYEEAALVLPYSEKASAALSRRCLQTLLREAAGTKSKDLADQIDEVLPKLPGYLQGQLDAVRNIGNFAAHTTKSKSTGEIVDVEPGEAEWNLDVLDLLFDFYYLQPKIAQEKRDALNKKLADAGKPPMK